MTADTAIPRWSEIEREAPRDHRRTGLRDVVVEEVALGPHGVDRRVDDDRRAGGHPARAGAREQEDADDVHIEDATEPRGVDLEGVRPPAVHSRVADDDVDAPEGVRHLGDRGVDRRLVRDIAHATAHALGQDRERRRHGLIAGAENPHLRALGVHPVCAGEADPARAARDDDTPALVPPHVSPYPAGGGTTTTGQAA